MPNGSSTPPGAAQLPGAQAAGTNEQWLVKAFRKCEAKLLSEKLERSGGGGLRGETRAKAIFPRKTKSCPRKEINHSTLCALSENSVYIVLMLNTDLTKIEMCLLEECGAETTWVERASIAIIALQVERRLPKRAGTTAVLQSRQTVLLLEPRKPRHRAVEWFA